MIGIILGKFASHLHDEILNSILFETVTALSLAFFPERKGEIFLRFFISLSQELVAQL